MWRVVHRRRKYARCCQRPVPAVRTAPGPATLIPRGLFTTEFCVNLLVAKYALGLPFNRVIAMLAMQGLEVAPGTLAGVARRLEELLAPLAAAIAARNAAAGHAHVDETSWRVFGQPADNGGSRWWLWAFTAADTVVYTIAASRSLKVLEDHYGVQACQLPEGRRPLVISSDFYSVYRSFSELDGVTSSGAGPISGGGSSGPATPTARSWAAGLMPGPAGSPHYTPRTAPWPPPPGALASTPGRPPRSMRRWRRSTPTAVFRVAARTCCTWPRRRRWPPWTANGAGWCATGGSRTCRWITTPPSGRSAPRSWAARTTTVRRGMVR